MQRCENCGIRLEDDPTATLCRGCAYRRKKDEERAAREGAGAAAPAPAAAADADALRERLRRVEETLRQPPAT